MLGATSNWESKMAYDETDKILKLQCMILLYSMVLDLHTTVWLWITFKHYTMQFWNSRWYSNLWQMKGGCSNLIWFKGNSCICKHLLTLSLDEISKGDIAWWIWWLDVEHILELGWLHHLYGSCTLLLDESSYVVPVS